MCDDDESVDNEQTIGLAKFQWHFTGFVKFLNSFNLLLTMPFGHAQSDAADTANRIPVQASAVVPNRESI